MKKGKILDFVFVFLVSLLISLPLINEKMYASSHDLTFHLNRIVGLADAFSEGQLLPKIYPYSNNGFGYASPLFYCDIFLYPFAIIYKLGFPLIKTYKMMLIVYLVATTISVLYVSKKVFKNQWTPYIATLLYVFSYYHIYDIYARSALGEVQALIFIPLVFYAIYEILVLKKDNFLLLGISFSCLVMSHLISSLLYGIIFAICIVVFCIVNRKNKKQILRTLIVISLGTCLSLLLCGWYLLPMFEQLHCQQYYVNIVNQTFDVNSSALKLSSIFNLFCNLDINGRSINDVISVGMPLLIVPVLYIFAKKNKVINYCLLFVVIEFAFILGIIPLPSILSNIQFLFRLYIIIYPLLVIISSYVFDKCNKMTKYILVVFIVGSSILSMHTINRDLNNNNNKFLFNSQSTDLVFTDDQNEGLDYNRTQLGGGEYLPICNNEDYLNDNLAICVYLNESELIEEIDNYEREYTKITFTLDTDGNYATLPLTWYKGYKAYCDNEEINVVKDPVYSKVGIYLSEGEHVYVVKYESTAIQTISLLLSALTVILTLSFIVYNKCIKRSGVLWQEKVIEKLISLF